MTGRTRHWGDGPEHALLLHCSLAHSGAWDGVARRLGDRVASAAPDLLGHGRAGDGDRTADYHDQVTAQAVAHLGDAPTHVIGHSFGATVALRLAIEHPGAVKSLTLIEPVLFAAVAGAPAYARQSQDFAPFNAAWAAGDIERATAHFIGMWGDQTPFDDLPQKQRDYLMKTVWVIRAQHPALWEDRARLLPRLGSVTCPVLLMEGGASPPIISEILSALALSLPDAQRATIPGAHHMGPITHPGPFAEAIGDFITSVA